MAMTYYAVTDDPNELAHWGIKGMKWGVRHDKPRHTGSRPRSLAYKKAQNKLGKLMKSGIKKAEARWKEYNSPENKQLREAKKYHNQTERALEKARKGKLKYKKLDDYQVQRITERLTMENQARQLSNKEQTFRSRLGKSIGEGIISGIGQGFGRRTSEWIARGSILKTDRMRAEQQDQLDARKEKRRIRNAEREANKKAEREFKQMQRKDEYEHERDNRYLEEKAKRAHLYGVKYTDDGKLVGDSYAKLFEGKNAKAIAEQQRRTERQAKKEQRDEYRATVRRIEAQQKEQKRLEDAEANKQREAEARRIRVEEARQKAAEVARQRAGKQSLLEDIDRRNARQAAQNAERERQARKKSIEQGWKDREERLRYKDNVGLLYGEKAYKHVQKSGPKLRFGSYDAPEQPTYTPVKRNRARKGRR